MNQINRGNRTAWILILIFGVIISSFVWAEAPPHAAYGPMQVGYNDVIKIDIDTAANVFAVSQFDYMNYQKGNAFRYFGGQAKSSPIYLTPPPGRYIVVIDNAGGGIRNIRAGVGVIRSR